MKESTNRFTEKLNDQYQTKRELEHYPERVVDIAVMIEELVHPEDNNGVLGAYIRVDDSMFSGYNLSDKVFSLRINEDEAQGSLGFPFKSRRAILRLPRFPSPEGAEIIQILPTEDAPSYCLKQKNWNIGLP